MDPPTYTDSPAHSADLELLVEYKLSSLNSPTTDVPDLADLALFGKSHLNDGQQQRDAGLQSPK